MIIFKFSVSKYKSISTYICTIKLYTHVKISKSRCLYYISTFPKSKYILLYSSEQQRFQVFLSNIYMHINFLVMHANVFLHNNFMQAGRIIFNKMLKQFSSVVNQCMSKYFFIMCTRSHVTNATTFY